MFVKMEPGPSKQRDSVTLIPPGQRLFEALAKALRVISILHAWVVALQLLCYSR